MFYGTIRERLKQENIILATQIIWGYDILHHVVSLSCIMHDTWPAQQAELQDQITEGMCFPGHVRSDVSLKEFKGPCMSFHIPECFSAAFENDRQTHLLGE